MDKQELHVKSNIASMMLILKGEYFCGILWLYFNIYFCYGKLLAPRHKAFIVYIRLPRAVFFLFAAIKMEVAALRFVCEVTVKTEFIYSVAIRTDLCHVTRCVLIDIEIRRPNSTN